MIIVNKLQRQVLVNIVNEYKWNYDTTPNYYKYLISKLEKELLSHDYETDKRFMQIGRRKFLRDEFTQYLEEKTYDGRGKFNDAFVDLAEYIEGLVLFLFRLL